MAEPDPERPFVLPTSGIDPDRLTPFLNGEGVLRFAWKGLTYSLDEIQALVKRGQQVEEGLRLLEEAKGHIPRTEGDDEGEEYNLDENIALVGRIEGFVEMMRSGGRFSRPNCLTTFCPTANWCKESCQKPHPDGANKPKPWPHGPCVVLFLSRSAAGDVGEAVKYRCRHSPFPSPMAEALLGFARGQHQTGPGAWWLFPTPLPPEVVDAVRP